MIPYRERESELPFYLGTSSLSGLDLASKDSNSFAIRDRCNLEGLFSNDMKINIENGNDTQKFT